MRLTGSRAYYRSSPPKMPPGLVELMEGLTREVLKQNPSDVYGFCAGHIHQLLEKRDGPFRQKSLSLEEKITRAQEKVRQRAEKRRQDYDKNLPLQRNSNIIKDKGDQEGLTLQVPQMLTSQESFSVIASYANNSSQDEIPKSELNNSQAKQLEVPNTSTTIDTNASTMNIKNMEKDVPKEEVEERPLIIEVSNEKHVEEIENKSVVESSSEVSSNIHVVSLNNESPTMAEHEENENHESARLESSESPAIIDESNETATETTQNEDSIDTVEQVPEWFSSRILDQDLKNSADENVVKDEHEIVLTNEICLPHTGILDNGHVQDPNVVENVKEDSPNENLLTVNEIRAIGECSDVHTNNQKLHLNNVEETDIIQTQLSPDLEEIHQKTISDVPEIQIIDQNIHAVNDNLGAEDNKDATDNVFLGANTAETSQEIHNDDIQQSPNIPSSNNTEEEKQNANSSNVIKEEVYIENINPITAKDHLQEEIRDPVGSILECETGALPTANVDNDISTLVTDTLQEETHVINPNDSKTHNEEEEDHGNIDSAIFSNEHIDENIQNTSTNFIESNSDSSTTHNNKDSNGSGASENVKEATENDTTDSNMDLETAAVTIQKVFRTFLFKSREDSGNDETIFLDEDDKNKEESDYPIASALINIDRRTHGITRMDTVLQTVNEEKSLSLSTDDSSTLSSAATIIQAHVRGFLVRNKLNSNKTISTSSLAASNSNEPSITSLEADNEQSKNKTVLNIHIVPEGESYLYRDESLITSMDLSLDSSPPSSINLHPLGYDNVKVSERRKLLKREDAIQSISPPSNNSGKLSEDFDSVKELSLNEHDAETEHVMYDNIASKDNPPENDNTFPTTNLSVEAAPNAIDEVVLSNVKRVDDTETYISLPRTSLTKMNTDEMDVVTPFISNEDSSSSKLMHSGEFHESILPTRVSRSDTSVVSGE